MEILTPKLRCSYPTLFEPRPSVQGGDDSRFSILLLIDKKDTNAVEKIKTAIKAAFDYGKEKKMWTEKPANFRNPLRDADNEPNYAGKDWCAGHYLLSCKTKKDSTLADKPEVYSLETDSTTGKNIKITDPKEIYGGCYVRCRISSYPYDVGGNRGVSFGLEAVQKLADGDELSGRASDKEVFSAPVEEYGQTSSTQATTKESTKTQDVDDFLGV